MKNWHESMLLRDICIFIHSVKCHKDFIQGFSKITRIVNLILKKIGSYKDLMNISDKKTNKIKKMKSLRT